MSANRVGEVQAFLVGSRSEGVHSPMTMVTGASREKYRKNPPSHSQSETEGKS